MVREVPRNRRLPSRVGLEPFGHGFRVPAQVLGRGDSDADTLTRLERGGEHRAMPDVEVVEGAAEDHES